MKQPPTFLREFTAKAKNIGFVFDGYTGNNHPRYRHEESGQTVIGALTPSDYRSQMNLLLEMERISGRKLPRANAGKYRHSRITKLDFTLSQQERESLERVDELLEIADRLRSEWHIVTGATDRRSANAARAVLTGFEEVRAQLARLNRIIPPLTAV